MKTTKNILIACIMTCLAFGATAQKDSTSKDQKVSILFGLNQPLVLKGFNFEVNYWTKHVVFDYSHGIGLHLDGALVGGAVKEQGLDLKVTHSLGFGVGYRITKNFNIRLEPKLHVFELYYAGEAQTAANRIGKYSSFTLGAGAYYLWRPFQRKQNFLNKLSIVPSVRYWPNVANSLQDGKLSYQNRKTLKTEVHKAANIGVSNTPLIINVSMGLTF